MTSVYSVVRRERRGSPDVRKLRQVGCLSWPHSNGGRLYEYAPDQQPKEGQQLMAV